MSSNLYKKLEMEEDKQVSEMNAGGALPARRTRVLVVGAGGFAGGFIVDEALRRGFEVWAGVRKSTSRQWLDDPRIRFAVFDFDRPDAVAETLRTTLPEGEKWDYIVYNLGATKVMRYADFSRINYDYLRHFTSALHNTGCQTSGSGESR